MASATSDEPVQVQIRAWLQSNYARVMDLFREWDDDNSGAIDKKEFRQAVQVLGLGVAGISLAMLPFAVVTAFVALWLGVEYKRKARFLHERGVL